MLHNQAIQLMNRGLWLVLMLSAPPILMASLAGLIISILQAVTQVQEQTTQYAVKFAAVILTLALFGRMMGSALYGFADQIFSNFAFLAQS